MKPAIHFGIYFCAIFLMSYYFVGMGLIKAIQLASMITVIHIAMGLIDKFYTREV